MNTPRTRETNSPTPEKRVSQKRKKASNTEPLRGQVTRQERKKLTTVSAQSATSYEPVTTDYALNKRVRKMSLQTGNCPQAPRGDQPSYPAHNGIDPLVIRLGEVPRVPSTCRD